MSSTSSADADSETEIRKRPPVHPLSRATERRLLRGLAERAGQGDAACQSASKIDPLAWWLVPVVHRGTRATRGSHAKAYAAARGGFLWTHRCKPPDLAGRAVSPCRSREEVGSPAVR
jgi:hypothetical protein